MAITIGGDGAWGGGARIQHNFYSLVILENVFNVYPSAFTATTKQDI
jgi:hypothetical protein